MTQKILLVRFSALGDLILTTGPIKKLREQFPEAQIDLLSSNLASELFSPSMGLNQIHVIPKGTSFFSLLAHLKRLPKYDVIIDWQGNLKSCLLRCFQPASFYGIQKHSRTRRQFVKDKVPREELQKHVVEKYYETLRQAFDLPHQSRQDLAPYYEAQKTVFENEAFQEQKPVVLHPYASQKNKEWPYFDDLRKTLLQKGQPVVLIGHTASPKPIEPNSLLLDLRNKTTLPELASLLKSSSALITTDSGPMHLGVAVGTPTIALFGPTTKDFGFYPDFKESFVIENNSLNCRPCHVHGGNSCPLSHHNCMKSLSTETVLQKIVEFL